MTDPLHNLERMLRMQNRQNPDTPEFYLRGVRRQRQAQEELLRQHGLTIHRHDNRPGLADAKAFDAALKLIWKNKPNGWWLYQTDLIEKDICTEEAFAQAYQQTFESPLENWFKKWLG